MNYRKIYEKALSVKLGTGFDIHHIDGDRKNNEITNLVALPNKLHQDYHNLKPVETYADFDLPNNLMGTQACMFYIDSVIKFRNTYSECLKWVLFRNSILYNIPSPYNFSYN